MWTPCCTNFVGTDVKPAPTSKPFFLGSLCRVIKTLNKRGAKLFNYSNPCSNRQRAH
jgi:hypothetical protein